MILTADNYFSLEASREYFSNSQLKDFVKCEAETMAYLNEELVNGKKWKRNQDKTCFLEGHYIHAWNQGEQFFADFVKENKDKLYTKTGGLRANIQKCAEAIKALDRQPMIKKALLGQKEVVLTAELFGVEWKIMVDALNVEKKRFADLKGLKSFSDKFWNKEKRRYENMFEHYGYDEQFALYSAVIKEALKTEDYFEPFLVLVTKEDVPDVDIVSFGSSDTQYSDIVDYHLCNIEEKAIRAIKIKQGIEKPVRCEKCDYCKSTKILTGTTHFSEYEV